MERSMKKRCVVSFADTPFYQGKMKRLEQSIKDQGIDFFGFTHINQIGAPPHQEIPYAFKPYAIQKVIDLGYETILWCDSPVHAIKDISPVFEYIEQHGYVFFDNVGHSLGMWTNDKCLKHFNLTRDEAIKIKMVMACCMGFSTDDKYVFNEYKRLAPELYPGSWQNHRHDQSVISCLIHQHDLQIIKGHESFFIYDHFRNVFTISDTVCLLSS